MATITFTLSAAHLTRAVDALGLRWGYQATLPTGDPNPQSKSEFVRQRIALWIKSEVQEHEQNTARAAVLVAAVDIT